MGTLRATEIKAEGIWLRTIVGRLGFRACDLVLVCILYLGAWSFHVSGQGFRTLGRGRSTHTRLRPDLVTEGSSKESFS